MPKSIRNIKKTKIKKVVHNRLTAPERVKAERLVEARKALRRGNKPKGETTP